MDEINVLEILRAEMKKNCDYETANAITKGVNAIVFVKYMQRNFPDYYDEVIADMNGYTEGL